MFVVRVVSLLLLTLFCQQFLVSCKLFPIIISLFIKQFEIQIDVESFSNSSQSENFGYMLSEVTLERQAMGFGFRIVGGTEEGSQVTVGHIVEGGAAYNNPRIETGDEILSIDGHNVVSNHAILHGN